MKREYTIRKKLLYRDIDEDLIPSTYRHTKFRKKAWISGFLTALKWTLNEV